MYRKKAAFKTIKINEYINLNLFRLFEFCRKYMNGKKPVRITLQEITLKQRESLCILVYLVVVKNVPTYVFYNKFVQIEYKIFSCSCELYIRSIQL